MFLSLYYLYVPAPDIEASVRYYTEVLRGELVWKIHAFEAWVACIRLTKEGPSLVLASHLEGSCPILIYAVQSATSAARELKSRGWAAEAGPFEIPNGPCYTFRDPAGARLAIYENQRPGVAGEFRGRFDTA
ncbi:MAG: hypothetical protein QOE70_166 [Chthoniobacter sp.]|nr:hypothetical protein [Chthoniobacter sp.]